MTNTKKSILAVGSLAFDSIQTPAGNADQVLGGSVNYFSLAASFSAPISVIGVVGKDFPKSHLENLSSRNIDISGIEIVEGKTFHWVGQYDQNLNEAKTLSTALNVFEHFNPKLSPEHKKSKILFLANIDPELQLSVLDQCPENEFIACDSMNFWITGKKNELSKVLSRVDLLSINEGEAYLLSGRKTLLQAAETIRGMGPSVVIIKRGEYGAICFTSHGTFIVPAYLVQDVVDPTGAGDTFAGGMIGYLAEQGVSRDMLKSDPAQFDKILKMSLVHGCVFASFTVEDFSIHRLLHLEKSEIKTRTESFLKMIRV